MAALRSRQDLARRARALFFPPTHPVLCFPRAGRNCTTSLGTLYYLQKLCTKLERPYKNVVDKFNEFSVGFDQRLPIPARTTRILYLCTLRYWYFQTWKPAGLDDDLPSRLTACVEDQREEARSVAAASGSSPPDRLKRHGENASTARALARCVIDAPSVLMNDGTGSDGR